MRRFSICFSIDLHPGRLLRILSGYLFSTLMKQLERKMDEYIKKIVSMVVQDLRQHDEGAIVDMI